MTRNGSLSENVPRGVLILILKLFCILVLVAVDRILKRFMTGFLSGNVTRPLIPGIVQLSYTENTGAAFGLFRGSTFLLVIVTSVLILALLYLIVSKMLTSKLINAAIILITAGGIGNLYDRIVSGYVVDYFDFTFMNYAIFNFADVLINIGALTLFIGLLLLKDDAVFKKRRRETVLSGKADKDSGE